MFKNALSTEVLPTTGGTVCLRESWQDNEYVTNGAWEADAYKVLPFPFSLPRVPLSLP